MAKNVTVTPADGDIQFENASGTAAGRIEQNGDDLVISNAVGNVLFGDVTSDVYIGDGVNSVDVLFEQSGAIKADTSSQGVTLTIGGAETDLQLYAPSMSNLSAQNSEATSLMINTNGEVGTRELGSLAFSSATYDNYVSWNLKTGGTQRTTVGSGGDLDIVGGTNVSVAYSAGGVVTISSTDNNTTYTAGTGLTLSGTEFSVTASTYAAASHSHAAGDITSGTFSTDRLPKQELGISIQGNFGQWLSHSTHATNGFNDNPTYWGWTFIQGNTSAPHSNSSQWYRGRFSLGNAYGLGTDSGDYWMELAIPRYSYSSYGNMYIRTCENGTVGSWSGVRAAFATDADTVDGNHASAFATASHTHSAATTSAAGFMSTTDKSKLDGIASGAEVNVQSDWNATSGDAFIQNKPTIPTNNNQLTNGAGYLTSVDFTDIGGTVSNTGGATRTNYDLGFKPPSNSYAGFRFYGTDGNGAGYFLIRGTSDNDVYTAEGITLVADQGWLTLAQRTQTDKGIRFMTGSTSSTRMTIANDGDISMTGTLTASGGINGLDINNGISGNNFNISGVNQLSINDPGEGIVFNGTTTLTLAVTDDSTDNILNLSGTSAKLQVNGTDVSMSGHTHSAATTSSSGFMSTTDKSKLDGIASGAEVNVQSDWNATSGDAFIQNKPTLGTAASAASTDFYTSLSADSWTSSPTAKYITVALPFEGGSGSSSYFAFDVFGYRDIGVMDSFLNYRVYAHVRSNGTETNSVDFNVYGLHQAADEFFKFFYKTQASGTTNIYIYIEEDYSGVEIFGIPITEGAMDAVTSAMISSSETAPTGVTQIQVEVAHPRVSVTAGTYGDTANGQKIDTITIDEHGHVTAVATGATGSMTGFFVEDGDGTEVQINNANEWKFVEGTGIDINWTDTDNGTDADPYDLTFGIKDNSIGITQLNVTDGTSGQVLTTNGAGELSFATVTSGSSYGWDINGTDIESGDSIALAGGLSLSGTGGSYTLTQTDNNTTYTAGTGLTLTGTTFSVTANTYAAASHSHSDATTSAAGFMSSTDKSKLDGIAASANNYSLPAGSSTVRGGFKIGYTENAKNYPVEVSNEQMFVNVPWTDTDTDTTYSTATSATLGLVKIGYTENGKNYPVELSSGQMFVNVPWTDTDTNTTYSAGSGLDISGTTFSVEADLRDGITHVGVSTSNYITFDNTNNHIDFYAGGNHVARMESDGDLHIKGDIIAFSTLFT